MFQLLVNMLRDVGEGLTIAFWHQPVRFFGTKRRQLRDVFSGLHPSTNVAIYTGVLWLIPTVMVDQYKSLYLNHLGVSAGELGVYNSITQLILLFSALAGGYLADAWGRRKTTNVFDSLSWALPALLLAVAPNKWFGVAAVLLYGFNMGANVSYNCLLVEKNSAQKRPDVYTVLQLVNMSPSLVFLPFLAGWWVDHAGLETAVRWMYGLFFTLVVVGIWSRFKWLEDDRPRGQTPTRALKDILRGERGEYLSALREFFSRPASKAMFFSRLIDEWMMAFWLLYVPLYMVHRLGLPAGDIARVNQFAVFLGFASLLLVIPAIHKTRGYRMIGYEQLVAGLAVLVLPLGGRYPVFWVCFASQAVSALAGTFFWTFTAAAWANMLEGSQRPRMLAGCYALMRVFLVPAGLLAAYLYAEIAPEVLLGLVVFLRLVNAVLLRRVSAVLSPMIEKDGRIEWKDAKIEGAVGR